MLSCHSRQLLHRSHILAVQGCNAIFISTRAHIWCMCTYYEWLKKFCQLSGVLSWFRPLFFFWFSVDRKGIFPINKERFSAFVPPAGKTMHNAFSVISEMMLGVVRWRAGWLLSRLGAGLGNNVTIITPFKTILKLKPNVNQCYHSDLSLLIWSTE